MGTQIHGLAGKAATAFLTRCSCIPRIGLRRMSRRWLGNSTAHLSKSQIVRFMRPDLF